MSTDTATPRPDKLPWTAHVATYLYPTLVTLVLVVIWEAVTRAGWVSPLILPSLSSIVYTAIVKFPLLMQMSAITTMEFVLGFLLSVAVGLPLGAMIVYSRPLETAFYPILVAFQIVPKAAVAPIFIVWLGTGLSSKVLIAFAIAFFPVVIDTVVGVGSNPFQVFWFVRFPNALPAIFGGLKVASTLAVVGAIVGEFVSAEKGLGYLVLVANGELDTQLVFACVLTLTLLGIIFYFIIEIIEKIVVHWHVAARQIETAGGGG